MKVIKKLLLVGLSVLSTYDSQAFTFSNPFFTKKVAVLPLKREALALNSAVIEEKQKDIARLVFKKQLKKGLTVVTTAALGILFLKHQYWLTMSDTVSLDDVEKLLANKVTGNKEHVLRTARGVLTAFATTIITGLMTKWYQDIWYHIDESYDMKWFEKERLKTLFLTLKNMQSDTQLLPIKADFYAAQIEQRLADVLTAVEGLLGYMRYSCDYYKESIVYSTYMQTTITEMETITKNFMEAATQLLKKDMNILEEREAVAKALEQEIKNYQSMLQINVNHFYEYEQKAFE